MKQNSPWCDVNSVLSLFSLSPSIFQYPEFHPASTIIVHLQVSLYIPPSLEAVESHGQWWHCVFSNRCIILELHLSLGQILLALPIPFGQAPTHASSAFFRFALDFNSLARSPRPYHAECKCRASSDLRSLRCSTVLVWPRWQSQMSLNSNSMCNHSSLATLIFSLNLTFSFQPDSSHSASVKATFLCYSICDSLSAFRLYITRTMQTSSILSIFESFVLTTSLHLPSSGCCSMLTYWIGKRFFRGGEVIVTSVLLECGSA